jgi:hypothetical protein
VCALENVQWCGELCFAGAAISVDGYLLQTPRRGMLSHYTLNECFVEGQLKFSVKSLTSEYEIYSNKCSEGLGLDHFYVQSKCNFLIED